MGLAAIDGLCLNGLYHSLAIVATNGMDQEKKQYLCCIHH